MVYKGGHHAHRTGSTVCLVLWHALIVATETIAHWPTGTAHCPCIDPFARDIALSTHTPAVGAGEDCNITRAGDRFCYPSSYGASKCAPHDSAATPECARLPEDEKPRWCQDLWCFVDPNDCINAHSASTLFPNATMGPRIGLELRVGLSFSYATCGYLDSYILGQRYAADFRSFVATLPSKRLRVSFPGDAATGYTVVGETPYPAGERAGKPEVAVGQGVGGTNRSGSILVFMESIMRDLQVPWEEVSFQSEWGPSIRFQHNQRIATPMHQA